MCTTLLRLSPATANRATMLIQNLRHVLIFLHPILPITAGDALMIQRDPYIYLSLCPGSPSGSNTPKAELRHALST
jgi:hypothetical protein